MPSFASKYVWRVIMGNSLGFGSGERELGGGHRVTRTQTCFLKVAWLVGSRSRTYKQMCDRKQDGGHRARRKVWLIRNAMCYEAVALGPWFSKG